MIEIIKSQEKKDEKTSKVSVLEMAQGAILEACNIEVGKVMENIFDLNTPPTKKREVNIKVVFEPSADRQQINVSAQSSCKLQPNNAIQTALYCGKDERSGKIQAVELVPNIPGQINLDGEEQEQPKELKLG